MKSGCPLPLNGFQLSFNEVRVWRKNTIRPVIRVFVWFDFLFVVVVGVVVFSLLWVVLFVGLV